MSENAEHTTSSQLTSSLEDSPAKTSAMPARDWESKDPAAVYGQSFSESFASYDPLSRLWKTSQLCLGGDYQEFWETWPPSGTMRSGQCFQRALWVPHIHGKECGLYPTPQAIDWKGSCDAVAATRGGHLKHFLHWTRSK